MFRLGLGLGIDSDKGSAGPGEGDRSGAESRSESGDAAAVEDEGVDVVDTGERRLRMKKENWRGYSDSKTDLRPPDVHTLPKCNGAN